MTPQGPAAYRTATYRDPLWAPKVSKCSTARQRLIGVVCPGTAAGSPVSSHVRVLQRIAVSSRVDITFVRLDPREIELDQLVRLDALLVQRTALPSSLIQTLLEWLDRLGIPLIYELDDALWEVPADKDPEGFYASYARHVIDLVRRARIVLTSTEHLGSAIERFGSEVRVIPNRLAESYWLTPIASPAPEANRESGSFRVLYMGQLTHNDDLELIRPAVEELATETPKLDFRVVGGVAESDRWFNAIEVPPGVREYPKFVTWFRTLVGQFDVAVAPLTESRFNSHKSGLRYMDYGAVGIPAIFSDVPAFSSLVRDGQTGLITRNDPSRWSDSLRVLRDDRELRRRIGVGARDDVRGSHMLGAQMPYWEEVLLSCM